MLLVEHYGFSVQFSFFHFFLDFSIFGNVRQLCRNASVLGSLANRGLPSEAANFQNDKELWAITSDNKLKNKHVNQQDHTNFLRPLCTVCFVPWWSR
jgi:hypothetical protein